ncbi:MAG: hypothetical protein MJ180_06320, partial [Candidatus Gastranaerophilales bacterium]|nr:hypothetical protein [Candidatus Gastranaerophilales bacterium]
KYLKEHGIISKEIENFDLKKIQEDMKLRRLSFVINTPTTRGHGARVGSQNRGFLIRTIAEMFSTPCFTSVDTARAYLKALCYYLENHGLTYNELKTYKRILQTMK